jgi:hypothetical protein
VAKNILFPVFFLISLTAFAQNTGSKPAQAKPGAPAKTQPATGAQTQPAAAKPAPAKFDTAIVKLFDKPAELKWVRQFKGRHDDASAVDITLGFDGRNCRGYLSYAKSRTRFKLTGTLDTTQLVLEERDMAQQLTGKLSGELQGRKLQLEWVNVANSIGSRIEAEELMPGQSITLNCSDNKWSSRYITRFNGARADMILVRTHNGALDGFLWVEADGRTYRLKGDWKPDGSYEMEALASGDRLAALLSGNLKPGQNTDCNWVGSGERRTFKFVLKDHFLLGCYEYADYATSFDVLYPRTPCPHCNTWLDDKVNKWVEHCQNTFTEKKPPLTPANRGNHRASAWPEIACWTDNVFSGYLTLSDTWTNHAQGFSFNFDLKANKEVGLADFFVKDFNAQKFLADWANKEMPKLPAFATDPKYREWLVKEGFPLFAVRREGMEISTLFHPQYGRQTLLVPYANLKPYLKKDGPTAEFVK